MENEGFKKKQTAQTATFDLHRIMDQFTISDVLNPKLP